MCEVDNSFNRSKNECDNIFSRLRARSRAVSAVDVQVENREDVEARDDSEVRSECSRR